MSLPRNSHRHLCLVALAIVCLVANSGWAQRRSSFARTIQKVQPKIVKIYGAGGIRGLEAYQSGFIISSQGFILTVWSYVLDTDYINVVLNDGRKFKAKLVGHDPRLEIAILKLDGAGELEFFNLDKAKKLDTGSRVLAFSNLFKIATGNERSSVLHGSVASKTKLVARRGAFRTLYQGPVYLLDAMTNNPGAAGGALTDRRGNLAGLLGKELKNSQNNTWINYSIPISELVVSIDAIRSGKTIPRPKSQRGKKPANPHTLLQFGVTLVPEVLAKTPPFIHRIKRNSVADKAGLRPDDLILFVNDRVAQSCKIVREELSYIDKIDDVRLTVQRGQELVNVKLNLPQ